MLFKFTIHTTVVLQFCKIAGGVVINYQLCMPELACKSHDDGSSTLTIFE